MQSVEAWLKSLHDYLTKALVGQITDRIAGWINSRIAKSTEDLVWAFLRDTTDSEEMNVDGDVTPVTFSWAVPAGRIFNFNRLTFHIQDDKIRADGFGGLPALTNGLLLEIIEADGPAVVKNFTEGVAIKRHTELGLLAGMHSIPDTSGIGTAEDVELIGWPLTNAGAMLRLMGAESIQLTVRDDLTGLSQFKAMVQGVYE